MGGVAIRVRVGDASASVGGSTPAPATRRAGGGSGGGKGDRVDRKKSAVYLHLLYRPDCLGVYDDSHFSVLCRARYVQQLKVLKAVCIRIHKPVLC